MELSSLVNLDCSLDKGWQLARTSPNEISSPSDLETQKLNWLPAQVPGTVAQMVFGDEFAQSCTLNLDEYDWWYQCEFSVADSALGDALQLHFDGLATLAQVWLNDILILTSNNMFLPHRIDVQKNIQAKNKLTLCFRSLAQELEQKRPRPKWKTNLVSHQQLRWFRTTLLGRIPGWSPPIAAVGPWRAVTLKSLPDVELISAQINSIDPIDSIGATDGTFSAKLLLLTTLQSEQTIQKAEFILDGVSFILAAERHQEKIALHGDLVVPSEKYWWPHTHGEPTLLPCKLVLKLDGKCLEFDLGTRGFKHLKLNTTENQLGLVVNGESIFCRGACWTVADIHALDGDEINLRRSLTLARDAGLNMLRVGGTMIYESDFFYRLCDELGILVWQDFMFANMDYPVDDLAFRQSCIAEARAHLVRLSNRVCVSVYCGNSEVQQQSAMMGQARELWSNEFFDQELQSICAELHGGIPYFPSTPCGGALPFSLAEGLSHYYGVGAYKRPINDAALAKVKFTPETLGFSHIPEPACIDKLLNGALLATHSPKWKARVPRDSAAGWDFEDIRDHYLALLFNEDPVTLRSHDPQRYLELSRVVTGEVIQRVFAIWRSPEHSCRGALIWFYKDLWPGAGWGLLDSDNQPKAVFYAVKRAAKNLGVFFIDGGLDGLAINLINETPVEREITLEINAYRSGSIETISETRKLTLSARSTRLISVDKILGYFADLNYSYRFGPQQHDLVAARMCESASGQFIHEDFYFPVSCARPRMKLDSVSVDVVTTHDGGSAIKILSPHFLQSVRLDLKHHQPEDNYFHLAPNRERLIKLSATTQSPQVVKGYLEALNLLEPIKVR